MKLLLVTLVTLSSLSAFGQVRQYLDKDEKILPGPEGASYFRETEAKGKNYLVKDFYAPGDQLAMEAVCSEIEPRLFYEGPYKTYFENGQPMEEGMYEDNMKGGLWKSYYENGQQKEEVVYEKENTVYRQHWDENGKEQLVNGSGYYVVKSAKFGDNHREIQDYKLITSYRIDPVTSDSVYFVAQEPATYKGGMEGLYKGMAKTMRYPADARRFGIQGNVYIEFVVDKAGKVRNARCIKGIGGGCDEESIRVISGMNKWTPAKVKGKPVMQVMVLPVAFKLG